jgi:hypothetical protein
MGEMSMSDMARDPKHRRSFEKLLYLAAQRGDADLVEERLSWGIDPNCTFGKNRTPLITNVKGFAEPDTVRTCRSMVPIRAIDETGLTALDYARRKLAKLQADCRFESRRRSTEQPITTLSRGTSRVHKMRAELDIAARDYIRMWWKERPGRPASVQRSCAGGADRAGFGRGGESRRGWIRNSAL